MQYMAVLTLNLHVQTPKAWKNDVFRDFHAKSEAYTRFGDKAYICHLKIAKAYICHIYAYVRLCHIYVYALEQP
jgi:hypothetical protein